MNGFSSQTARRDWSIAAIAAILLPALVAAGAPGASAVDDALLASATPAATHLECEYRIDPLGIDIVHPRLSWQMESDRRGARQTAYQLLVASSPELLAKNVGDLWDTGKVDSDQTAQIEYAGKALHSRDGCVWKVRLWDADGATSPWSAPALWTMGLLDDGDWQAKWIGLNDPSSTTPAGTPTTSPSGGANVEPSSRPARMQTSNSGGATVDVAGAAGGAVDHAVDPDAAKLPTPRYLRKDFSVGQPVRRATVYATALGLYELRLNGRRVGDHLLAPEWTDYHKRVQYQTYDVTSDLKPGANAIGAILGNGWYCGDWQLWKHHLMQINHASPALLVQLEIEYADGSRQLVATDETWRCTTAGPLRFSGIYEGETYDARMEMPGWAAAAFDDRAWHPADVMSPAAGRRVWQRSEPIRVDRELKPVSISEPKPGVYVLDLGQNIAGWCRLRLHESAGTRVELQMNEVLNPDGTVYTANLHAGHLSRGDRQVIRYTCRGGGNGETFEPHFTYQGFRYAQITGLQHRPDADTLTGCVFHTSFAPTGTFTCSNPLLNRLVQNIQWSQRGNMMGVPTDCCQRDERCGYTGDMNFFAAAAVYNFDIAAFTSKWLNDVFDDQESAGWFPDFAPSFAPPGGPGRKYNTGWSDAAVTVPYTLWQTYGDTRVISDHYAALQHYASWISAQLNDGLHTGRVGNGDWLNLGGGADNAVIGTAYDAFDFKLLSAMAAAIGRSDDAAAYRAQYEKIAAAFAKAYIQPDGSIKNSSQTGYALAFTMGLVPPELRQAMADRFADSIRAHDNHIATGFIGTPRLLPALHVAGRDDLAYALLLNDTYPSWLFEVKSGATTMWERWNGWTADRGFASSGMNSFNHYAFGSVGQYLFAHVAGIQPAAPGYHKILIAPTPGAGLTRAQAEYDSIAGPIRSAWKTDGNTLTLTITIPANTTATIAIPTDDPASITEGGKAINPADGITPVDATGVGGDRVACLEVGAGSYEFNSKFVVSAGGATTRP